VSRGALPRLRGRLWRSGCLASWTGRARVLARRKDVLEANGVFSPPDRRRLSASGTIRQLPDQAKVFQRFAALVGQTYPVFEAREDAHPP
jgi:hypothetical protein